MAQAAVHNAKTLKQIAFFGLFGATLVLLDLALFWVLSAGIGITPWLAKLLSVSTTVILSYVLNARITFDTRTSFAALRIFIVIYAISIILNVIVFQISNAFFGYSESISVIIASFASAVFNFICTKKFVFHATD